MKLLLKRTAGGIGDWIMMASVIRHINVLLPTVEVLVAKQNLPPLADGFYNCANIEFRDSSELADGVINHVGYPRLDQCDKHLIAHMLDMVNVVCQARMEFSFDLLARQKDELPIRYSSPRVVMVSCGRDIVWTRNPTATGYASKNWGADNFLGLARCLQEMKISIVQVGHRQSPKIPGAEHCLGTRYEDLKRILYGSTLAIVQIDGLAHICGHLDMPTIAIYCGQEDPIFTHYPSQMKLSEPTPTDVALAVKSYFDQTSESRTSGLANVSTSQTE